MIIVSLGILLLTSSIAFEQSGSKSTKLHSAFFMVTPERKPGRLLVGKELRQKIVNHRFIDAQPSIASYSGYNFHNGGIVTSQVDNAYYRGSYIIHRSKICLTMNHSSSCFRLFKSPKGSIFKFDANKQHGIAVLQDITLIG